VPACERAAFPDTLEKSTGSRDVRKGDFANPKSQATDDAGRPVWASILFPSTGSRLICAAIGTDFHACVYFMCGFRK
jgi:hypothetical protein